MVRGFKARLKAGELLVGSMVTLGYPAVAEIFAQAGFDWLFLDAEHSAMDPAILQKVLQGAGREMPCLVRLPAADPLAVKKALDIGAAGIIVPMVNTAEQAAQVVSWAKYPPQGVRGVGLGRAAGYGLTFQDYLEEANKELVVVVQAEHREAVENITAIVQVPGVDAVLVGPYDLSASMGLMGQVGHPAVQQAIGQVTQACRASGVPLGIFGVTAEAVKPYIAQGYRLIVAGVDTLMLGSSARQILGQLSG